MKKTKINKEKLAKELCNYEQEGIVADTAHLKKDSCAQFSDFNEWIREYVVNGFDAMATLCEIWGEESKDEICIHVKDNGHGMHRQRALDFFHLYRSRKEGDPKKAIGKFGIGKLSVAAIPGQSRFYMQTSTGKECWVAETGSLLDDRPIEIRKITPVPEQGTLFSITYPKTCSLKDELNKLSSILRKYVKYLGIDIKVYYPKDKDDKWFVPVEKIGEPWTHEYENFGHTYTTTIRGKIFEIILGVGLATQEIYQNRVFISDKYNLLSYDKKKTLSLPHLRIRVNSPDFELPFGRHRLRNEEILGPLSFHIRNVILPGFFNDLLHFFENNSKRGLGLSYSNIEDMAIALMVFSTDLKMPWSKLPIFNVYPAQKYSLAWLEKMVTEAGKVYLAENGNTGVDYSFFDAPVLLEEQPADSIRFLKEYFNKELVNLSLNDVVIEAPSNAVPQFTEQEMKFENSLGFHHDIIEEKNESMDFDSESYPDGRGFDFGGKSSGKDYDATQEIKNAGEAFRQLSWKVNYLVGKDGISPAKTHKFILKENTVVLNLFHPEVKNLVTLSTKAPKLAGHWAVAMCLTEDNRILSSLTSETREDLLLIDAMAKVNSRDAQKPNINKSEIKKIRRSLWDLLRGGDSSFGLN